ncbi:MAG: ferredoxin domain-containing protein [Anaerolineae bacterium]
MSLHIVAELMAISARTAPKAVGQDFLAIKIVEGEELHRLGQEMIAYGERTGKRNFDRDGKNVLNSEAVVLIGLKDARVVGLNCAACGHPTCVEPNMVEGEFRGPQCAMRLLDMGIAIGSAVKTASLLNVDNRVMYRVGVVARQMGLIDADVVMGIPLSATGKSIYFDR